MDGLALGLESPASNLQPNVLSQESDSENSEKSEYWMFCVIVILDGLTHQIG